MEILVQLEKLFLAATPTAVILFLFYLFLRWAFFTPILKAMDERRARVEGARKEAAELEEAAQKEQDEYEATLRQARAKLYEEQEAARQAVLDERGRLLKAVRHRAQEEVDAAKKKFTEEIAAAHSQVQRESETLAVEIAQMLLSKRLPMGDGRR
jgi:F-type H+-transporting ATPase subunit b